MTVALRVDAHSPARTLTEREKTTLVAQVGSLSVTPSESAPSRSVSVRLGVAGEAQ